LSDDIRAWLETGEYLPDFMRDFHDQKDVFKALHGTVNVEGHAYAKEVDWVEGQCYTIDIFLWWMAKHGYVLRRARHKGVPFSDLSETLDSEKERRWAAFK
jgi:hypothetical protein